MKQICNAHLKCLVLAKASFLDKRLEKIEQFLTEEEAANIIRELNEELEHLEQLNEVEPFPENLVCEPSRKKKHHFFGLNLMEGDEDGTHGPQSAADELTIYQ